jgi:RHS repeat-associated protein
MQMQLSYDVQIPDGLLAANALLSEKPRLGFRSDDSTLRWGSSVVISSTAIGICSTLYDSRIESRYTGKERDAESGLDYFGARYYGSTMGRFMSPDDDSGEHADAPQSWNLYSYVQNNPITNTDPDGHDCVVQSRIDDNHESISVSSGNCAGKGTGSGQSATYVPGTVTGVSVNGGNSIDIGYNSYDGQSSGVTNSGGAPAFDHPGIDGPANAAIFGQIGNNGMGAIKWFGEQMAWNVVGGVAAHGIGLGVEALQAARAARAAEALAVAERVTQHAFVKHAGEFGNITRNEFQGLVQETMANPSEVRSLSNGRTAYWSDSQQMVVIENGTAPSQSTAFRPTGGKGYFDNLR